MNWIEKIWILLLGALFYLIWTATLLAFMGLLTPVWIWCVLGMGLISGVLIYWKTKKFDTSGKVGWRSLTLFERGVVCVCLGVGLHTLLAALTPEVRSDPVRYHISMAMQYAVRGQIEPLRETVWWSIPQFVEVTYALGIVMANDTLAKLFHWIAGVISVLGVYSITRRFVNRRSAGYAVLLWVLTPMVSYEATTTYVDLFVVVWIQAAVWAAMRSLSKETVHPFRWMYLSSVFLGMAFGTKYTAWGVQGIAWGVFPVWLMVCQLRQGSHTPWEMFEKLIGAVILPGLLVLLVASPWLVRNLVHTGNPIYPLYNSLLGLNQGVDRGCELFFLTVYPGSDIFSLRYYKDKLIGFLYSGYSHLFAVSMLSLLLPFIQIKKEPGNHPIQSLYLFLGLSLVGYLVLTGNLDARFFLPTLSLCLLPLGKWLAGIDDRIGTQVGGSARKRWIMGLTILFLTNYAAQRHKFFVNFEESFLPILSEQKRWEYYQKHNRAPAEGNIYEKLLPKDAYVYGINFPYRIKSVAPVSETIREERGNLIPSNLDPLQDPFYQSNRTAEDLQRIAGKAGITHIFIPVSGMVLKEEFWTTVVESCPPEDPAWPRMRRVR